ncbi:DUF3795 domain-containing protein [Bacteroidota bacterium]
MNINIACCGINCELCDAKIATDNNDDKLRAITAEKWQKEYNAPQITADSINCTGCRIDGVKFSHCEYTCEIRKCVNNKGFETCGDCSELDNCEIVAFIHKAVPETKENLKQA